MTDINQLNDLPFQWTQKLDTLDVEELEPHLRMNVIPYLLEAYPNIVIKNYKMQEKAIKYILKNIHKLKRKEPFEEWEIYNAIGLLWDDYVNPPIEKKEYTL